MNWILHTWWRFKLKQQESSGFKMKNETECLSSTCKMEIAQKIEAPISRCKFLVFKLGIKTIQNNRSRLIRNELGQQLMRPNPLYTQQQVVKIVTLFWLNSFVIVLFVSSEGSLFYLSASLFVPGASTLIKASVAIFLALANTFLVDYGLKKHFEYRHQKARYLRKEISETDLSLHRDYRFIGYILLLLSLIIIVAAALSRIRFLEFVPTNLPEERRTSVQAASDWASVVTAAVTIAIAIFLGLIKRELSKITTEYGVCKYWKNALARRNNYTQAIIQNVHRIHTITETIIHKYWQLTGDLKRIFKLSEEYDDKYNSLQKDYLLEKKKPDFTVTETIYRRYAPIQCAHEELFRFGILNGEELREKLEFARRVLHEPEAYLREHTFGCMGQNQLNDSTNQSNGRHIEQTTFQN